MIEIIVLFFIIIKIVIVIKINIININKLIHYYSNNQNNKLGKIVQIQIIRNLKLLIYVNILKIINIMIIKITIIFIIPITITIKITIITNKVDKNKNNNKKHQYLLIEI